MVGQSLAHYRIEEKLGAGGMGVVYRATDTKLGRQVAIKVLPESFAKDPAHLARFEREARMLAALNHPHIAAIHELGESGKLRYLVLELVPGETLKGPLPIEEALRVCGQIAEACAAAHEQGIMHRDLKPANVKITPEGKVKVLDFGLAKTVAGAEGAETVSVEGTREGSVLGTPAYMSPEQARGSVQLDKRTDIWAFGWCCTRYWRGGRPSGARLSRIALRRCCRGSRTGERCRRRPRRTCEPCCGGACRRTRRSGCGTSATRGWSWKSLLPNRRPLRPSP